MTRSSANREAYLDGHKAGAWDRLQARLTPLTRSSCDLRPGYHLGYEDGLAGRFNPPGEAGKKKEPSNG